MLFNAVLFSSTRYSSAHWYVPIKRRLLYQAYFPPSLPDDRRLGRSDLCQSLASRDPVAQLNSYTKTDYVGLTKTQLRLTRVWKLTPEQPVRRWYEPVGVISRHASPKRQCPSIRKTSFPRLTKGHVVAMIFFCLSNDFHLLHITFQQC